MGMIRLLFITILGGAIGIVLSSDLQVLSERLARYLLKLAVKLLPECIQARYKEEWEGHLAASPGNIIKIIEALGFIVAARSEKRRRSPSFLNLLKKVLKLQWAACKTETELKLLLRQFRLDRTQFKNFSQAKLLELNTIEDSFSALLKASSLQKKQITDFFKR